MAPTLMRRLEDDLALRPHPAGKENKISPAREVRVRKKNLRLGCRPQLLREEGYTSWDRYPWRESSEETGLYYLVIYTN